MDNKLKPFEGFLAKETPKYGGCMVCLVEKENGNSEFLLVERHKCANGDLFIINSRLWYDYLFLWEESKQWKILWKYEG